MNNGIKVHNREFVVDGNDIPEGYTTGLQYVDDINKEPLSNRWFFYFSTICCYVDLILYGMYVYLIIKEMI